MDRCDFYSDEEYRQALEIQEQEYREEIALEQEIQDFGYYEYLLNKFTGLTPDEIVKLKSQLTEAMELLEFAYKNLINKCSVCKCRTGKYSCTHQNETKDDCSNYEYWQWQHADRYEKLKNEVKSKMINPVE